MIGMHLIKCWSKAQHVVSLSSAEAELYAAVRAAAEMIGAQSLAADIGWSMSITLGMDASAAIALMNREGLGKAKHISTQWLWVQERIRNKEFRLVKVDTKLNPADLFTKQLAEREMVGHVARMGCSAEYAKASRSDE